MMLLDMCAAQRKPHHKLATNLCVYHEHFTTGVNRFQQFSIACFADTLHNMKHTVKVYTGISTQSRCFCLSATAAADCCTSSCKMCNTGRDHSIGLYVKAQNADLFGISATACLIVVNKPLNFLHVNIETNKPPAILESKCSCA